MAIGGSGGGSMKVLGVLGTLVWDRIWHPTTGERPVEQWGGIAYSIAAAAAACPPGWTVAPIIRVGWDLAESAADFLGTLPNLSASTALTIVAEPNNRVELRYRDAAERTERLTGGVSGWSWEDLEPLVRQVDALYLNFISGYELDLRTAEALRGLPIPVYADLHSLYLDTPSEVARAPRRLPDWERWISAFDGVQLNEQELALTGPFRCEPLGLLPTLPLLGPALSVVTLGARGATFARARSRGPVADWPLSRPDARTSPVSTSPHDIECGLVPTPADLPGGDPTGCGDIWGSVLFCRLIAGDPLDLAISTAHSAAGVRLANSSIQDLCARIQSVVP